MTFDVQRLRLDFPILGREVNGAPLVYLDNAATSQKPEAVLQAIDNYYRTCNANVHRAAHALSDEATRGFEDARENVRQFINAASTSEIVFTRGTTEAINLVASCFTERLGPDDEILITHLEHHSNIVPWQMLCEEKRARLRVVPVDERGELDLDAFELLLTPRTKLLAITHEHGGGGAASWWTLAALAALPEVLGQARAVEAIRFGIGITRQGYNLFAMGPEGIGRRTIVRAFLERDAPRRAPPPDWCYVFNFETPHRPRAISLPPGRAHKFHADMARLVEDLRSAIPATFESDEYRSRRQEIESQFGERQEGAIGAVGATIMAGASLHEGRRDAYWPAILAVVSLAVMAVIASVAPINVKNLRTTGDVVALVLVTIGVTGFLVSLVWSGLRTLREGNTLRSVMVDTAKTTSLVFIILLGEIGRAHV